MNIVETFLKSNWRRLSLDQYGDPNHLTCVLATPRFRASSHVIFFVLVEGNSDPIFVVKVPRLPGDRDHLNREVKNLQTVQAARPQGFESIPCLVAYEDYLNHKLLIETALTGQPMKSQFKGRPNQSAIEAVISWLIELHKSTAVYSTTESDWNQRLVQDPWQLFMSVMPLTSEEQTLIEQTQKLTSMINTRDIPLVFEHGDLAPPNILRLKNGRIGIVDWELAEPSGLPAMDIFFFLTVVSFFRRRARSNSSYLAAFHETFFEPSAWARPFITRYAESLHLAPETLVPLFILCWSRYVTSLVMRLHDLDSKNTLIENDTAQWIRTNRYYSLWQQSVKNIDKLRLM